MKLGGKLLGSAPVFTVSDISAAVVFYTQKLGFEQSYEQGEPACFVILDRDDFSLQLVHSEMTDKEQGQSHAYVFASEVDLMAAEFTAKEVELRSSPQDFAHGMREFSLEDLDGNRLTFGAEN